MDPQRELSDWLRQQRREGVKGFLFSDGGGAVIAEMHPGGDDIIDVMVAMVTATAVRKPQRYVLAPKGRPGEPPFAFTTAAS